MGKKELKIKMEDKVIIPLHGTSLVKINGKDYIPKQTNKNEIVFVRMDKAKFYERAKAVAERVAEKTNLKEWLTYAIMDGNLSDLERLEKELKKKKVKIMLNNL